MTGAWEAVRSGVGRNSRVAYYNRRVGDYRAAVSKAEHPDKPGQLVWVWKVYYHAPDDRSTGGRRVRVSSDRGYPTRAIAQRAALATIAERFSVSA